MNKYLSLVLFTSLAFSGAVSTVYADDYSPRAIAERLERRAEHHHRGGDARSERAAREAAREAREATRERAREIEREFHGGGR